MIKRNIIIIASSIIGLIIILSLSFILYLDIKSKRIGDTKLEIKDNSLNHLNENDILSVTTYNIGFGAYDRDFSFFMDEGYLLDGTKVKGKYGKGISKENTLKNTSGAIEILKSLESDFYMVEEVDTSSTRSYKINQYDMISKEFLKYSKSYAINFHSGFLPYPLNDMHGVVNSGILTMSKYKMEESYRIELPVETKFPTKFFDLDRCLNLVRYKVLDKELVMISAHLSAYDNGGVYRKKQLELLNNLIKEEYNKGNYVIVGGDFNHDLVDSYNKGLFETKKKKPDWLMDLNENDIDSHFSIKASSENPSCRDADEPYKEGHSFLTVVDGFIVSDNIEVVEISNIVKLNDIDINFMYSDHNAVNMKFKLKQD